MLSFNKKILFVCFFLTNCGFHPVYKQYDSVEERASLCSIDVPFQGGNRAEQAVWAKLEDLLNPHNTPCEKNYILSFQIEERGEAIAIRRDGVSTRSKLSIFYHYILKDKENSAIIHEGKGRIDNSVDVIAASEFASYIAAKDSRKNVALEVAEAIQTHISLFLENKKLTK